jgi:hypothetical protein
MSQYIVKIVQPAREAVFYRDDGGALERDCWKATRFGRFQDAASRVAAGLMSCGIPDAAEVHIVQVPPDQPWTIEEILQREG